MKMLDRETIGADTARQRRARIIPFPFAAAVAAAVLTYPGCGQAPEPKDAYGEQLDALRSVDPKLIGYEKMASFGVACEKARAILAGPGNTVLVAGDKTVFTYDGAGKLVREFSLGDEPQCLALSEDGSLYVGYKKAVGIVDGDGKELRRIDVGGDNSHLSSIALHEGEIIVADAGERVVLRLDADGKVLGRIGERDPERNIPGFVIPSPYFDIAMAEDGLLRVANPGRHTLEAYTLDGDLEFSWGTSSTGTTGFSGCCNPCNFVIGPEGSFITAEKGLPRVKVYDESGAFSTVVAAPDQFGEGHVAPDVSINESGHVLVLDPESKKVLVYRKISGGSAE